MDDDAAARPLFDEIARDQAELDGAPARWLRWWGASGKAELRCILMAGWDPVGANDASWDEYDDYLAGIANIVRVGLDTDLTAARLAEHLTHVTWDFMGIWRDEQRHRNHVAAWLVVHWYRWASGEGRTSLPG